MTHLHVSDILTYIYCIFVHLTSLFEVLGQRSKEHMKFWFYSLSISYRLNCFSYDCHNWLYICSFLHEDGIIVFQGQSSRSHVKHGIFTRPPQYEWHIPKTPCSKQLAICGWYFPAPNVCTCNAVKNPIMSLKCCEKSYVSCRPYCVDWRKYLNCRDAFTCCWHTDIHSLYFCTPDFII